MQVYGTTTFIVRDLPASYHTQTDENGNQTVAVQDTPAQYSVFPPAAQTPWVPIAAALAAWMYFK